MKTGGQGEGNLAELGVQMATTLARFPLEDLRSFARQILGDNRLAQFRSDADLPYLVSRLLERPTLGMFQELRRSFPSATVEWDHIAEHVLPMESRLGRVQPVVPSLRRVVGREAILAEVLGSDVVLHGGQLHVWSEPSAGTTTLAVQIARMATDFVPVVVWLDGATAEALTAGGLAFAAQLGLPQAPRAVLLDWLGVWLQRNQDWMVVVDDAPEILPAWLPTAQGRLVTTGRSPRPGASLNLYIAPWWDNLPHRKSQSSDADVMSEEAQALLTFVASLAPAPIPSWVFSRSLGFASAADAPHAFEEILRSPRAARDAARELVQRGFCRWIGTSLRRTSSAQSHRRTENPWVARVFLEALAFSLSPRSIWDACAHASLLLNDDSVEVSLRFRIAQRMGRWLLSENEAEEAVAWFVRCISLGWEGPSVADSLNDLGVARRKLGRTQEAIDAFERALTVEGCPDYDVAATRFNLGHALRDAGRLQDALSCYESVYQTRLDLVGPAHVDTLAVHIQRGAIWFQLGDVRQARAALTECVAGLARVRPLPRSLLASAQKHLAQVLARDGELDAAIRLVEHCVSLLVTEHDDRTHPEVMAARAQLDSLELAVLGVSG